MGPTEITDDLDAAGPEAPAVPPPNQAIPDPILAHQAESIRLGKLTDFLSHFAPKIGESRQPGPAAGLIAGEVICGARNDAVLRAFQAVERIAAESFNFKTRTETGTEARP